MSRGVVPDNASSIAWNKCPGCAYPQSAHGFCWSCQMKGYHLAAYHVACWLTPPKPLGNLAHLTGGDDV